MLWMLLIKPIAILFWMSPTKGLNG